MSTQLSSQTWPIRSVQVQHGSVAHPKSEQPLRAASGPQEDPEHRGAELNPPRTIPLTMETLAAHVEDSLQRLRRRVEASIAQSACPASSSTILGVGPEEQEDLQRRMDEFMLHKEYHKSTVGEDGEIPLDALGSPPQTEMGFYRHGGHSITTETTKSTRTPESKASRPTDNGSSSPRPEPWGSGSYGRTFGQTSIRIRRPGCDSSVRGCQGQNGYP